MKPVLLIAAMVAGMARPSLASQAPLMLMRDGKAASVILIADKPSAAAREASRDLQMWLEKASGAIVAVQPGSRLHDSSPETRILVGDSLAAHRCGVDLARFDLEEIRIQTFPDTLAIVGEYFRHIKTERPENLRTHQ